ncbi:MAG: DNA mismatch repair endonuclease MutL [Candidatus Heimdallarchaeota archaeon]
MTKEKQTIVQLDKKTINKIAAGEVVERPASVVKELVENSIDALATEITVIIKGYGLDEIKVIDNGIGMSREDVSLAWQSHTTSKLHTVADLKSIYSLGFRGEALASIASISMLEIITKTADQNTGTIVRVKGGELELTEEHQCANGTTISVKNLFYNVPARKKFLKTKTTELGHIIEIVSRHALIRPTIHFKLQHEASILVNSPKSENSLEPFIAIFGVPTAKKMIPIAYEKDDIQITGYTSMPDLSRSTRDHEMFFVNKRYVKSKLLSEAVEEAYKTLLMRNRYPVVFVNIKLDSAKLDVNIHPTKREIRFAETTKIATTLTEAIAAALASKELWRETKTVLQESSEIMQSSLPFERIGALEKTNSSSTQEKILVEHEQLIPGLNSTLSFQTGTARITSESQIIRFSESFWVRPLGQVLQLYALCESSEGIAIVDIHAAHERVRYEELLQRYEDSKIEIQELLQPITFTLNPEQIAFIQDYLEQFQTLGLSIELFGGNIFLVRSLPVVMDLALKEEDIVNLLEEIRNEMPKVQTLNERIDLILKKMACHSVVRGGDFVDLPKLIVILRELSACTKPFTCPHGRPTIIKISRKGLEKEFGRII